MRNAVGTEARSGLSGMVAAIAVIAACGLAGCSTDVVRLDSSPSFSLNDAPGTPSLRPSAGLNRSSVGASNIDLTPSASYAPSRPADRAMEVAALPPPSGSQPYSQPYSNAAPEPPPQAAYGAPPSSPAPRSEPPASSVTSTSARKPQPVATTEKGEAIEVKQGDTLYKLAKQHKVSLSDLMQVNALSSPALKPGQTLYLPKTVRKPITRTETAGAGAGAPATVPTASPEIAAKYDGTYTVQKGDSLYALALKMKVPMAELQQVNGISDVRKVKPGAVLKVPGSAVAAAGPAAQKSLPVTAAPVTPGQAAVVTPSKVPPAVVQKEAAATDAAGGPIVPPARPVLLNGEKQVAAIDPKSDAKSAATGTGPLTSGGAAEPEAATPAEVATPGRQATAGGAAAVAADVKLRWPVRGKIVAGFGPRTDGTHNDGVNVQVPQGTEVHAAEAGAVAYAGSELKGYGNLVLIRHDNGWITAYAHNSEILVKRGDRVKRGQVLAKAGKSGQVDQPQVHFELRQGSKPVDPMPFMEKM